MILLEPKMLEELRTWLECEDAKHWRVFIDVHHDEGWQLVGDARTVTRVYPHQVTTTAWKTTPATPLPSPSKEGGT